MKRIIFVLIFFLAVSAVSAADNQTFTDLQDVIDQTQENGVVNLTSDYSYSDGDSQITVSHPLTINGNGHVLDGKSKTRIMTVVTDNVIIKNITFTNGNSNEGSGALEAYDATVCDCVFTNNHGEAGGALYLSNGNVSRCTFINNSADYDGGALLLSESTVTDSLFDNNRASNGGAVLCLQSMIYGCRFTNNHADLDGGAVYLFRGTVEKSVFINNTAGLTGGALDLVFGKAKDCYFENNSAVECGGAIYNDKGEIVNCTFKNNKALEGNDIFNHPYQDDYDVEPFDVEPAQEDSNKNYKEKGVSIKSCDTDSTGNPIGLLLAGLALLISRKLRK